MAKTIYAYNSRGGSFLLQEYPDYSKELAQLTPESRKEIEFRFPGYAVVHV